MSKITGFLDQPRVKETYAPVEARLQHYHEFLLPLAAGPARLQASRCMDCGIP